MTSLKQDTYNMKQIIFLTFCLFGFVQSKTELKSFQMELIKQTCQFQDEDYFKDLCELQNKVPEDSTLDYLKLLQNESQKKGSN